MAHDPSTARDPSDPSATIPAQPRAAAGAPPDGAAPLSSSTASYSSSEDISSRDSDDTAPTNPPATTTTTTTTSAAPQPTYWDAVRTLSPADVAALPSRPCVRESLLTGMGAGFGVGGLRLIWSAAPWQTRQYRAMSWAVGAFVAASGASHAWCQRRRTLERLAMQRANAIVEERRRQKRREWEERRRAELEREEREGGLWKWVGWR